MLQIIFNTIVAWVNQKNRWWLALLSGLLYPLALPPFNAHAYGAFFCLPFLSLCAFVPLFLFSLNASRKRAFLHCYLFGVSCCLGQYYWVINDTAPGLWLLIILGLILISLYIALFYVIAAFMFRVFYKRLRWVSLIAAPAAWVCIEHVRSLGEFSFPWTLAGYSLSQFLSIAQLGSVTGVFGLSFIVVFANILFVAVCIDLKDGRALKRTLIQPAIFLFCLCAVGLWGAHRSQRKLINDPVYVALIQNNMDQNHWGNNSLDTSAAITQNMIFSAARKHPDLIILPESALFCYLARTVALKNRVIGWFDSTHIPMVLGTLHWNLAPAASSYPYLVYNSAFLLDSASRARASADSPTYPFTPYFKIKLVPFSEAIPLQGVFHILSRVNLGQADFKSGSDSTVMAIGNRICAVPLICYEIIYPDFVRRRINRSTATNCLLNITNDGWFGRSSGPYQHVEMARLRCIENGIALARCANSGISMLVDAYGRTTLESGLYKRDIVYGAVSLQRVATFYSRYGDWPVFLSWIITIAALAFILLCRMPSVKRAELKK